MINKIKSIAVDRNDNDEIIDVSFTFIDSMENDAMTVLEFIENSPTRQKLEEISKLIRQFDIYPY